MAFTELTVRLLLLFFPGIICFLTVDLLTVHRERKALHLVLYSYVYGLLSYLLYYCWLTFKTFYWNSETSEIYSTSSAQIAFFTSLTNKQAAIDVFEIFSVTILAVVIGVLLSMALNHYSFHDLARLLKITKKFGQPDVWSFVFNSNETQWATFRDLERNLMFQGYIRAFSDVEEGRKEILLSQVKVYNEKTGEFLYEAEHLYVARPKDNLTIQLHVPESDENEG